MPGIKFFDTTGRGSFQRRLIFREGQSATQNFQLEGRTFKQSAIPKPKFLFFVRFNSPFTKESLPTGLVDGKSLSNAKTGIVFPLKAIDRPKIQPKTETLNQYNKKRVIQTMVEYQSVTMRFHDDVADRVLKFWADYFAFYYGDGGKNSSEEWSYDVTRGDFKDNGSGWGFRGRFKDGSPENQHYLSSIDIIQFYGQTHTSITFVNPIITMMDHDEADYAEGTTGSGIVIQFDYEGIVYNLRKQGVTEENIDEFGFTSDFLETTLNERFSIGSPFLTGNVIRDIFRSGGIFGSLFNGLVRRAGLPPTGASLITASLLNIARKKVTTGSINIGSELLSFGSNAAGVIVGNVVTFPQLSAGRNVDNTADILQRTQGISSTMNNFGRFSPPSPGTAITGLLPSVVNQGTSSTDLAVASSNLSNLNANIMNGINQQNNRSSVVGEDFASAFGGAAHLATSQQVVDSVESSTTRLGEDSLSQNSIISVLPDGKFALTSIGAAVMNSLRTPTSAVGTRVSSNPWKNNNHSSNNFRALNIEKGFDPQTR